MGGIVSHIFSGTSSADNTFKLWATVYIANVNVLTNNSDSGPTFLLFRCGMFSMRRSLSSASVISVFESEASRQATVSNSPVSHLLFKIHYLQPERRNWLLIY